MKLTLNKAKGLTKTYINRTSLRDNDRATYEYLKSRGWLDKVYPEAYCRKSAAKFKKDGGTSRTVWGKLDGLAYRYAKDNGMLDTLFPVVVQTPRRDISGKTLRCKKCDTVKDKVDDFYTRPDGTPYYKCKSCHLADVSESQRVNSARVNAYHRRLCNDLDPNYIQGLLNERLQRKTGVRVINKDNRDEYSKMMKDQVKKLRIERRIRLNVSTINA